MDETPDAPVPGTPTPEAPPAATPALAPVPALDVGPPAPLEESQQDGGSFYFRGRTEGTTTENGAARTEERTTTVEGGVTYGSGDLNGDGLTEHQLRVDGSVRNQTGLTPGADPTSTTTVQGDLGYTYTPSANVNTWVEGGFTTTSDGTTRTTTNYVEGGVQGTFGGVPEQAVPEQAVPESALARELGDVYLNPEAAQAQIEGVDRGFEAGGRSFTQVAALLRERGDLFGAQSLAGLLDPQQVEQAVAVYADQTQAAIEGVKAESPQAFERAVVYTQAARDEFTKEFGPRGEELWNTFQATAERDGYVAAAAGLPPSESVRAVAEALDAAKEIFGAEVMNAAEDQVGLAAYRATLPEAPAPSQDTPSQDTPSQGAPSRAPEETAPEPALSR